MPQRAAHISRLAKRNGWPSRERNGRGGGREYPLACLPAETRNAIAAQLVGDLQPAQVEPSSVIAAPQAPAAANLTDWQRECAEARGALVAEARRIGVAVGMNRAVDTMVKLAREGGLPDPLQGMVPVANARAGDKRTLSRGSLFRWLSLSEQGFAALAPKFSCAVVEIPAWLPLLLALYQRPTKPSVAFCIETLEKQSPPGAEVPSESAARRWLKRISPVDLARGRMGARELKSIRPFVRRDSSHMWPGDCYTADGHTFDAEVAHPAHGRAFRPEITSVLDIATRRCVGWSAGLAESTWAVLDAQRNAIETNGICALWYVDNGSGYRNAMQSDAVVGFASRVGMTITHSLPYNSQARGVEERSHQSIWVRGAKQLPTYMGADMDREAKQKVFKLTRRDIKRTGSSVLLMPWTEFLAFCQRQVDAYNARPHRTLPRVRDAATGKLRHMSPDEAWQQAIDEGWQPLTVSAAESADLFRPYKLCSVIRGEVRLFNNTYFSKALEHYHGERLQVGYDIHDASRVWVRDAEGRLVCVAGFEANSRAYFPQPVINQAKEKRALGIIRRAEVKIDDAKDELNPQQLIEHQASNVIEMPFAMPELAEAEPENVVALRASEDDPPGFGTNDLDFYRWMLDHPERVQPHHNEWLEDEMRESPTFRSMVEEEQVLRGMRPARRSYDKDEEFEVAAG